MNVSTLKHSELPVLMAQRLKSEGYRLIVATSVMDSSEFHGSVLIQNVVDGGAIILRRRSLKLLTHCVVCQRRNIGLWDCVVAFLLCKHLPMIMLPDR